MNVFGRQRTKQRLVRRRVLGTDRPHRQAAERPVDAAFEFLWIWQDREAVERALAWCNRRQSNARVERHHAAAVGQQRVDVELHKFRQVGGELANADQDVVQRLHVGGRMVAKPGQQARYPGAADHLGGEHAIERWQADGLVGGDLHRHAALPEQHDRAEHGVDADADN